jgi:hypothetical protein
VLLVLQLKSGTGTGWLSGDDDTIYGLDQGDDNLGEGGAAHLYGGGDEALDAGYSDGRMGHLNTEAAVDHVAGIRTGAATPSAAT